VPGRRDLTPQDPDGPLVRRAQQGDREALAELYRRHERRAYNLALRITGDPWEAADVGQDAFVKALSALKDFRTEARFSTWLHRIVLNTAYDHLRRRRPETLEEEALEHAAQGSRSSFGPGDPGIVDPLPQPLREALLALPEPFRLAVVLCDLLDFGYAEAADILQVREGTIKSRLFRARALLARDLTARGYVGGVAVPGNNGEPQPVITEEQRTSHLEGPGEAT
jgi:RNA polymerase sigma-70 factor, ECF subfamily